MHDERRFNPQHHHTLVSPQRQARWDPPRFLARLGLQQGQTVLDLGCGPGFWTIPLAELVGPTGKVWALDVSQEMLDALAARNPPPQVHPLCAKLPTIDLPDDEVDLAWGAFVYHEVEPPQRLAVELRRVTKPDGRVIILEWRPDAKHDDGPPRAHRLSPRQLAGWLREAGFGKIAQTWHDVDAYLLEAS
ncbi:MAG: methyltransferase domain-containing protein [Anaerolineae bacterium]|nr:methyltransferase domain-containing protein [Anaerolineae bacterium]MDH7474943.1 methyltransferase domain-containing protein [Anaerolineae bacterium]